MKFIRLHQSVRVLILWIRHKMTDRQFFILSSVVVGLSAGLVAVGLKFIVHQTTHFVTDYSETREWFWLYAIVPMFGLSLTTVYVVNFLKGNLNKGSAEIQYAIAKQSSILPSGQMYSHVITSALTVGFGGSTGLESPIVSTGAAIGSNYARAYTLSYKERTILLACGSAAGIAAAFNAPIAGVLFAIEVVLTDISLTAFIPLIIAAACGALLSKIILKEGLVMSFTLRQPFDFHNVPFYILLGLLAGLLSLYYTRTFNGTQRLLQRVRSPWLRLAIGGTVLAILIMIFPPLFGEGYHTVSILADLKPAILSHQSIVKEWVHGDWLLLFLVFVMLSKSIAAGLTLGSGGNGGNFGPSLFMGAYLGFSFARFLNQIGLAQIPETNFALVGMAGVLSGIFHSPLSAIFLIAEITGGYELMIPLMIVSALSLAVAKHFEPLSMEAKKLSERLKHSIANRDHFLLSKIELDKLIETDFIPLHESDLLQSLIDAISKSKRNTYPVLNQKQELVGLIHLDHVRATIFQTELYATVHIKDLMVTPSSIITPQESLHDVLKKFDDANQWNLPVIENNQYVGFVSKSSILSKYREELMQSV
ncbi:MAG TPA: chloride channel protein [Cyclobacteriaceae bacterium]|nr:chloride channel protein [Cyclobacteriaceae bacterium]